MIHYVRGNILDSPAEALVNPVNCVGVMGKGLALEFKKRYPENYEKYRVQCLAGLMKIGNCLMVREDGKIIVNFPTKDDWAQPSQYIYIAAGLIDMKRSFETEPWCQSMALPALGCGLGGLQWKTVKRQIETHLGNLNCEIYVYPPDANR